MQLVNPQNMSRTSPGSIYKKMSEVMRDIRYVGKDSKNVAQGFKFRSIDSFVNTLYPALVRHGVFMAPRTLSESHELKEVVRSNGKAGIDKHVHLMVEYTFYAEDGSYVTVGPIAAEGLDSGDKATNKALSAALKYALIQTFSVPTEDMAEADFDTPEISPTPVKTSENPTSVTSSIPDNSLKATEALPLNAVQAELPVAAKKTSFRKPTTKAVAPESKSDSAWE